MNFFFYTNNVYIESDYLLANFPVINQPVKLKKEVTTSPKPKRKGLHVNLSLLRDVGCVVNYVLQCYLCFVMSVAVTPFFIGSVLRFPRHHHHF